MAPSKNQRAGKRQAQNTPRCPKGHELITVKVVKVFGRARFERRCECDGYTPLTKK